MKHSGTIEYNMKNSIDSANNDSYDIGIVYEMSNRKAIVLDSKGRFVFIRRKGHMKIGHTVKFKLSDVLPHKNKKQKLMPLLSAAAAVLIAALVLINLFTPFAAPIYGYIDIDVNPSTEFEFDKNLNVINVVSLNKDSSNVIDELSLCGKPVHQALSEYIEKLISMGVIDSKSENFVLLSAALNGTDDKAVVNSLLSKAQEKVTSIAKSQKINIRSEALSLSSSDREKSSKNNISMGKYYLYLKARENGSQLDRSKLTDTPVYHLAKLSGLFSADKKDTLEPYKRATTKPADATAAVATIVTASTATPKPSMQSLPQTSTQILYTNTPHAKNTAIQSANALTLTPAPTPTPSKVKSSISNPTPPESTNDRNYPAKSGSTNLKLEFYNRDKQKRTQGISLDFKITNTGSSIIDLKDLKIRYYFTKEGESALVYSSYYFSHGEESEVHGKFVSHPSAYRTDHYIEIYFDQGTLLPNKEVYAFGSITQEDWGYFEQYNDYSFDSESKDFTVQDKITVYVSNCLVWGKEPN